LPQAVERLLDRANLGMMRADDPQAVPPELTIALLGLWIQPPVLLVQLRS
jgi:hypothetical protein